MISMYVVVVKYSNSKRPQFGTTDSDTFLAVSPDLKSRSNEETLKKLTPVIKLG